MESIESSLRKKFQAPPLQGGYAELFRHLGAFWCHFGLHKRRCDLSGADIISVFSPSCPNPIWNRALWIEHAQPPLIAFDPTKPFFEQAAELFRLCPLPHNIGVGNENCDFTDDCWYCKDLLLSHQCMESRDCHYCYRLYRCNDCQFCAFSFTSELCVDIVNCVDCFQVLCAVNSRNCRESAFLFDCRDCADCFECEHLRHKRFCFQNEQLSEEEYRRRRAAVDLSNRSSYLQRFAAFQQRVLGQATWKGTDTDSSEASTGSYLAHVRNCLNTFFVSKSEDCVNFFRGISSRDVLDSVGIGTSELVYLSANCMGECYELRFCSNVQKCRNLEYCMYCYDCSDCFACFGLVGKKYHIFNRAYDRDAYELQLHQLREAMTREGVYGTFFPPSMAPNPFDESISSVFFPLDRNEQKALGFQLSEPIEVNDTGLAEVEQVPTSWREFGEQKLPFAFWDPQAARRVQITARDLAFAKSNGFPLPYNFYLNRLRMLCGFLPLGGAVRALSVDGNTFLTALPPAFDTRTIGEEDHARRVN